VRTIVTGAGGFIGSHVVEIMLGRGWDVVALVHYNGRGSWGHLDTSPARQDPRLTVVLGDVTDRSMVESLVQPDDTILHLAALIGIPYSYHASGSYVQTNVIGTHNVLEAARQRGARRVVVTSTSEVYGTARFVPITEDHPLQAQSPYAATKIAADKLAESYHLSFELPVVTLRPFNTYGPRQSARAFIPTVLSQALAGAEVIEVGNLEPRRDLTFVTDTATAFALCAEAGPEVDGSLVQCGYGEAITMGELARLCLRVAGSDAQLRVAEQRQRPAASEVQVLLCDPSRARALLGWTAEVGLEEGLERTAEYLRGHADRYKTSAYAI
jgi:NAD dependent epimerase/dehydratase